MMKTLLLPVVALAALAAFSGAAAADESEAIAAMEGGTPLPAGTHTFVFPDIAKQSISFISDAEERIAGVVSFSGQGSIGSATFNVDEGTGSGSLAIAVAAMRTGDATRDEHLRSSEWMDAETYPFITFSDISLKKVGETVWEVTGTWQVKDQAKTMTSLANVRFIPVFPRFGENIVRVRASFDLPIKELGVSHPAVGSPAVAAVWNVEVTLLGMLQSAED